MLSLSKAKLKFFVSLHRKKYRGQHRMFLAEGQKVLQEALRSAYRLESLIIREGEDISGFSGIPEDMIWVASEIDFKKLSTQVQPEGVIGIFNFPAPPLFQSVVQLQNPPSKPTILLEDLRDPGNLGTLLRTADWFGFSDIICSASTAEVFNPKVVRASMGSLFRLNITYVEDFYDFVSTHADQIWAADMEGTVLGSKPLNQKPMILMGNEANGISEATRSISQLEKVTIPRFGESESLNVGIAAGILLSQWRLG